MNQPIKIHVAGDAYWAYFYIPAGKCGLKGKEGGRVHAMRVGAEYIYQAIKAACAPDDLLSEQAPKKLDGVEITRERGSWMDPERKPAAFYEVHAADETIPDHHVPHKTLPLLQLVRSETQQVEIEGVQVSEAAVGDEDTAPEKPDVLVTWFGELARRQATPPPVRRIPCKVHIQVGLASPLEGVKELHSQDVADPEYARILVVNVGELCDARRIRKSLSYEAIAVDLLRFLRGNDADAVEEGLLKKLSMTRDGAAPYSILAVRLNDSAVFVYTMEWDQEKEKAKPGSGFIERGAWLLCHRKECAPLSQPEVRQMVGYTGFVSAQTAAAVAGCIYAMRQFPFKPSNSYLKEVMLAGVRRSLVWQRTNVDRGCLHMLFKNDKEKNWIATSKEVSDNWRMNYESMFEDIVRTLKLEQGSAGETPGTGADLPSRLQLFDAQSAMLETILAR